MLVKRWKLSGGAAALLLGLLAIRPAAAVECRFNWNGDEIFTSADLDGNGIVDGADLSILLGEWCSVPEKCAANLVADLNEDGKVDCVDQELLLGNWGRCEDPAPAAGCADIQLLIDTFPLCTVLDAWSDPSVPRYGGGVPSFDLDTSGIVDMHDVNIVNCLRGPADGFPPYADVNRDGFVDGADQGLVLGAFGQACPDRNQDGKLGWPDIYVVIERWP